MLSSKPELAYELSVLVDILASKVPEQAAALPYKLEKTPAGGLILIVRAEVVSEPANTLSEDCYLNLGGTRVARCTLEPLDD
jgi:hypothetical protein